MVLTEIPRDPLLDLDPWVGQRACSFRFYVTDAVSNLVLGELRPIRNASLTHDTGKTVKRQLQMSLGAADTAAINPLTERISVTMIFASGAEYPLGKYMFAAPTYQQFTSGRLSSNILYDEMFLIDQKIKEAFNPGMRTTAEAIQALLANFPIQYDIEPSIFNASTGSWGIGTNRGAILESLAVNGDYFSPWFNNHGIMKMIRTFNPAKKIADLDLDTGNRVLRNSVTNTNDLITAPNTIIVTSNASNSPGTVVSAVATIPISAPNSVPNRGFEIVETFNLQVASLDQAQASAEGLAQRAQVVERVQLTTPPDPRHDSYNVIRWNNDNWLELSWSMALIEGGTMNHLLRKAYS